jgi:polysaccharide biosynthesis protein PslH
VKILFLCHRVPYPPNRGGRIRPFNLIKHLGRDHDVTLASLLRADDDAMAAQYLRAFTKQQILAPVSEAGSWLRAVSRAPTLSPSSFAYFHSPHLARSVRRALADAYDLVFVHCSSMAGYVESSRAPAVLDFGDMDSQKWLAYVRRKPFPASLAYLAEGYKVGRAEARAARRFGLCTCTTRAEAETLERYGAARQIAWFPNGVDAEYYRPSCVPYDRDTICFLGRMDYYPNQDAMTWFCDQVFAPLRIQRPGLKLSIIGANPSRSMLRLAERPGISVTGSVPDVRPHACRAALSVAPLKIARGTQNKILESLAMGVPVVASACAARGTDTVPGEHLLVAREPRQFIAAIARLLDDPHERQRLAAAGRQRVLTHHDWAASMRQLDTLLAALTARHSGQSSGHAMPL